MYRISFYVPAIFLEKVKEAMFAQGAGRIGNYSHCAWQTKGEGQYCSLEGSEPYKGQLHEKMCEVEFKVEMVCADEVLMDVLKALVSAHPYDEPAYEAYQIVTLNLNHQPESL